MKKLLIAFSLLLCANTFIFAQKSEIKDLDTKTFKQLIGDFQADKQFQFVGETPVVIAFYAVWCGPCRKLIPELLSLQSDYGEKVHFYRIDVDKEKELARLFGVQSLPTIVLMNHPTQYSSMLGYRDREALRRIIDFRFF